MFVNNILEALSPIGADKAAWTSLYYYLKSGDTWYRRERNTAGGYFILWFSPDAGVTWEELLSLDITESDPVIDLTHQYRHRIVDDEYHVDQTLTATGYAGTEGVDWENLYVTSPIIRFIGADVGTLPYTNTDVCLRFNKILAPFTIPDIADFTVSFSGGDVTIVGVISTGDEIVNLVLDRVIAAGETGSFTYTPGTNLIYAADDNENSVGALSGTITNNVT